MKKLLCILSLVWGVSVLSAQEILDPISCGVDIGIAPNFEESRGYKTFRTDLWPSQIIPYRITASALPGRGAIGAGINIINKSTNICLVPKGPNDEAYISFEESEGSVNTSTLGHTPTGTTIKLNVENGSYEGVVVHELLHSLGLLHEHQRPDRDEYITVHHDNIQSKWAYAFRVSEGEVITPYDYQSILHYGSNAFAKDYNKPTMSAINGFQIGSKGRMTDLDIAELNHFYPESLDCDSLYQLLPPKPRFRFEPNYNGWCDGYSVRVINETIDKERFSTQWAVYNGINLLGKGSGDDTTFRAVPGINQIFLTISNEHGSSQTLRTIEFEVPGFDIEIFPNPIGEELQFSVAGDFYSIEYEIFDIHGGLLMKNKIFNYNCEQLEKININRLGAGVYLLKVKTRDGDLVKRFVKRK